MHFMSHPFVPRVGGTMSADIAVPEHDREVQFYSQVLTTGENPFWREDLMNNQGMPVIGLGKRIPEYADLPLKWMPHIQVADVAASAERAVALGGKEIMHGKDDNGNSQWAVLEDLDGVAFGIMPVVPAEAIPAVDEDSSSKLGCIAWLDLTVANASASRDFYREVVGWAADDVEMKDGDDVYVDYNMLSEDGKPAAGICHARGGNQGVPPVWMLYLPVGDMAESLRRVEEGGGKIIKERTAEECGYHYAVIQDPVGVTIALVQGSAE